MTPETPITDALWAHLSQHGWGREHLPCSTIMESHEKLERELAAQQAHADEIYKAAVNLAAKLEDDLAAERARVAMWKREANRLADELEKLAAERALADRLGNAMLKHCEPRHTNAADVEDACQWGKALTAWKGACK